MTETGADKQTPAKPIAGQVIGIVATVFLSGLAAILLLISTVIRIPSKIGDSLLPMALPAVILAGFAVLFLLRFILRLPVRSYALAGALTAVAGGLLTYDMLVTSKNSMLMLSEPKQTAHYALQPPSPFEFKREIDGALFYEAGGPETTVALRPLAAAAAGADPGQELDRILRGAQGADVIPGTFERMIQGAYPGAGITYDDKPNNRRCTVTVFRGQSRFHELKFCGTAETWNEHFPRFKFFRSAITRMD